MSKWEDTPAPLRIIIMLAVASAAYLLTKWLDIGGWLARTSPD